MNGRLRLSKRLLIIVAYVLVFVSIGFYMVKDFSNASYWTPSGFEKNQALMREEFFKKEVSKIYFRKVGYYYLTKGRFFINRVDKEFANLLELNNYPIMVAGLILITIFT